MRELEYLIDIFKRVFLNNRSYYVGFMIFIVLIILYLKTNGNLFNHLDANIDTPDPELTGRNKQKVEEVFNSYCKDLIDSHAKHITGLRSIIIILITLLKILLIYLVGAGLYTFVFVPHLKNSKRCLFKNIYKYFFKYIFIGAFLIKPFISIINIITLNQLVGIEEYVNSFNIQLFANDRYNNWLLYGVMLTILPGILLEKNKTIGDIMSFNHMGKASTLVSYSIYLFITLLYFIYLFMNIYLTKKMSKNNCYILKNLEKRKALPDKKDEITKEIDNEYIKHKSIVGTNVLILTLTLIIYGLYTDVFSGFTGFFKSGSKHADKITEAFSCNNDLVNKIK